MYSVRASFDSYLYWSAFLFVSVLMTYFLMSMISLANAEEEQSSGTVAAGYMIQSSHTGHHGTSTSGLTEEEY